MDRNFFADYMQSDLTATALAIVESCVDYDFSRLEHLVRDLDSNLLVGSLVGPFIILAERMFGSREELLRWMRETHEHARRAEAGA